MEIARDLAARAGQWVASSAPASTTAATSLSTATAAAAATTMETLSSAASASFKGPGAAAAGGSAAAGAGPVGLIALPTATMASGASALVLPFLKEAAAAVTGAGSSDATLTAAAGSAAGHGAAATMARDLPRPPVLLASAMASQPTLVDFITSRTVQFLVLQAIAVNRIRDVAAPRRPRRLPQWAHLALRGPLLVLLALNAIDLWTRLVVTDLGHQWRLDAVHAWATGTWPTPEALADALTAPAADTLYNGFRLICVAANLDVFFQCLERNTNDNRSSASSDRHSLLEWGLLTHLYVRGPDILVITLLHCIETMLLQLMALVGWDNKFRLIPTSITGLLALAHFVARYDAPTYPALVAIPKWPELFCIVISGIVATVYMCAHVATRGRLRQRPATPTLAALPTLADSYSVAVFKVGGACLDAAGSAPLRNEEPPVILVAPPSTRSDNPLTASSAALLADPVVAVLSQWSDAVLTAADAPGTAFRRAEELHRDDEPARAQVAVGRRTRPRTPRLLLEAVVEVVRLVRLDVVVHLATRVARLVARLAHQLGFPRRGRVGAQNADPAGAARALGRELDVAASHELAKRVAAVLDGDDEDDETYVPSEFERESSDEVDVDEDGGLLLSESESESEFEPDETDLDHDEDGELYREVFHLARDLQFPVVVPEPPEPPLTPARAMAWPSSTGSPATPAAPPLAQAPSPRVRPRTRSQTFAWAMDQLSPRPSNSATAAAAESDHEDEDQLVLTTALGMCVVCQTNPRAIVLRPCNCLVVCDECREALAARRFKTCPTCRRPVTAFCKVYQP
ncbi:hypothetical protein AMAG_03647 [Allomyces macrogynus ATCC 38327]|uniref:RING-type domain-containing protein n=1 Tax=Allomyces macrogynus (strain ATCC 38327) TaxID=578462 RepID=A0A0L0SAB0_ALLM3|nr:hypothetical protein AMAG_03647 [Allomyces macrogynus ATCC 38327]|eukprot:KNE59349.1 hypothetical protein AMAG_03647 [Allomyces macrogynus ATCC 38327]